MLIEQTRQENVTNAPVNGSIRKTTPLTKLPLTLKRQAKDLHDSGRFPTLSLETIEKELLLNLKMKPLLDKMSND